MAAQRDGIRWPDGGYVSYTPSFPGVVAGVAGNYYWNPGAPDAPSVTMTGMLGKGRDVFRILLGPLGFLNFGATYLRDGMTSADTLGPGTTSNVSTILPSVSVNSSYPIESYVPRLDKSKVSSIDAGISGSIGASTAHTFTVTPQQIADFVTKHLAIPAMGPDDQLSPFARTLKSGSGTVGTNSESPVRYLGSRHADPLGNGMGDWRSSAESVGQQPAQPPWTQQEPGALLGLMQDYLRGN